jgi:hypothetical protein
MQDDQGDKIATALDRLHAGGWSVGDPAFYVKGGGNCARRHRPERREPDPGRGRDGLRGVATGARPSRGGRDVAGSATAGEGVGYQRSGETGTQ